MLIPTKKEVLDLVSRISTVILPHYEECVEEVSVVLIMVDDSMISCVVALAQSVEAIDVVGMPVSEMFDVSMLFLNLSKHPLLVFAVLEKASCRPLRMGSRSQNPEHLDVILGTSSLIGPNKSAACFM
jgi:hypothetical protein